MTTKHSMVCLSSISLDEPTIKKNTVRAELIIHDVNDSMPGITPNSVGILIPPGSLKAGFPTTAV